MKRIKKLIAAASSLAVLLTMSACGDAAATPTDTKPQSSIESSVTDASEQQSSQETSKPQSTPAESDASPQESSKQESSKQQSSKQESSKQESSKQESSKQESSKQESSKQESSKQESSHAESSSSQKKAPIESITLSDKKLTLYVDGTYRLRFSVSPENADQSSLVWRWSDDSILTVVSDGTITAHKIGKATITIRSDNGVSNVCEVTVKERPPEPLHDEAPEVAGPAVSSDWFNDAVFVGDSVTSCLSIYCGDNLGDASFLYSVGLGYHSALWDLNATGNIHPLLNGEKVTVDEGIKKIGKKKVFIMMGMNDFAYGIDDTIEAMKTLTDRILAKSPDVQIYMQSVTPLISSIHRDDALNNENIAIYNNKVKEVCLQRGFIYVDVAYAVSDDKGNLIDDYCVDPNYMGLHLSQTGCQKWIEYLKKHVQK